MLRIVNVVGCRPNFVKMYPLMKEMKKYTSIEPVLVHTGQHYDYRMSQIFFKDLNLPEPDVHLDAGSTTSFPQAVKIMREFEKLLIRLKKVDIVVVVGDVDSTLICALTAAKLSIPVAHIEAGLRSYDRSMPEEGNRVLTDTISDYLFTPSIDANENLHKEGFPKEKVFMVGNIMIDTLLAKKGQAVSNNFFSKLGLKKQGYAVLTLHRPSNVENKAELRKLLDIIGEVQKKIKIVFPVHPRTGNMINNIKQMQLIKAMKNLLTSVQ